MTVRPIFCASTDVTICRDTLSRRRYQKGILWRWLINRVGGYLEKISSDPIYQLYEVGFKRREAVEFNRAVAGGVGTGGEPVQTITGSKIQWQHRLVVF